MDNISSSTESPSPPRLPSVNTVRSKKITLPDIRKKKLATLSLLSLPRHIRKKIWHYALHYDAPLTREIDGKTFRYFIPYSISHGLRSRVANLLATCGQIHDESAPIFYQSNCFVPIFYETHLSMFGEETPDTNNWDDDKNPLRGYQALGISPRYIYHLRSIMIKYAPVLEATYWSYEPKWVAWLLEHAPLIEHITIRHFNFDFPMVDDLGPCGLQEVMQSTSEMMGTILSAPCLSKLDILFYPDGATAYEMIASGVVTIEIDGEFDIVAIHAMQLECMPQARRVSWVSWRPMDRDQAYSKMYSGMGCCQWAITLQPSSLPHHIDSVKRGCRQPPSRLLRLPAELREMIWKYAFQAEQEIPLHWPRRVQPRKPAAGGKSLCFTSTTVSKPGKGRASFLCTNKQIFNECVALFYGQNTVPLRLPMMDDMYLEYIGAADRWIPKLGIRTDYLPFLRAIAFEYSTNPHIHRDRAALTADVLVEIRRLCPKLEYIRLHIFRNNGSTWSRNLLCGASNLPQYIREEQRVFRAIRGFPNLKTLDIVSHAPLNESRWGEHRTLCRPPSMATKVDTRTLRIIRNTCFPLAFRVRYLDVHEGRSLPVVAYARWVIDFSKDLSIVDAASSKATSRATSTTSSKAASKASSTATSDVEMEL